MNKSEIAEQIVEYVRRNHNSRSDELMKLIAEYDGERAIAESQAQPKIRWRTGKCEQDTRPHLENGYHICHNWRAELGDGEPSPPPPAANALKLSAELKAARTAWHMSYGVPVSAEHARFMEAIGGATDYLDALTTEDRCGNCDHHSELHSDQGCFVQIQPISGNKNTTCPCEWNKFQASSLESGAAQEVSPPSPDTEDILRNLLAVIHRDGGHYASDHGLKKAGEDAESLVLRERAEGDTRELKAAIKDSTRRMEQLLAKTDDHEDVAQIYRARISENKRLLG